MQNTFLLDYCFRTTLCRGPTFNLVYASMTSGTLLVLFTDNVNKTDHFRWFHVCKDVIGVVVFA